MNDRADGPETKARRAFRLFFMLLAVLVLTQSACSKEAPASRAASTAPPAAATSTEGPAPSADRAMRITVEMAVVVSHRDAGVAALRAAVQDLGGYVSSGEVSGSDATGSAAFEVKVPARAVGALRARVSTLGEIRTDNEKAEDVTEARADVRARLANARAEEARMLAILTERTGNLADVVAVEKELARVRETIERFEAEERVLEGQIAMATVKVQLETSYVAAEPGAVRRISVAATEGLENLSGFIVGTGVLLLSSGPTLLVVAGFVYIVFLAVTRLRKAGRGPVGG
jgi:hypothetical protein